MTSAPKADSDHTVFRAGPGMWALVGMAAFAPMIHMYLALVEVVARHFNRLGSLMMTFGTLGVAATYVCVVIVGVVVLKIKDGKDRKRR